MLFRSFYNYLIERGGKVVLEKIEKPQTDWKDIIDVFENVLKHEQHVTTLINNLKTIAIEEKDHATSSFMNWFVDEQVEEEANAEEILNNLKMTEGNKGAIFMLDRESGSRVYTTPAPLSKKA